MGPQRESLRPRRDAASLGVLSSFFKHHAQVDRGTCPVWGSEFTTKAAALQGLSAEIAPALKAQLLDSVIAWTATPLKPNPLFESI
jgi:hypothetical protein